MSKLKFDVSVIFTKWDIASNTLPRLLKSTVHIPAEIPDDLPLTEKYKSKQDEQKIAAFWKKRGR